MRQAHARLEQHEDELTPATAAYPPLRAVPEQDERTDRRRAASDLDEDLFDTGPAGRGRPRRPSGAAANYARAATGDAPRRTVRIGGHGAQTALRPTPSELKGPRPDRIAAWAVGFAILLALLAALVGG